MIDEQQFKKHAQEALTSLQGDLVLAGDDYGFKSSFQGGVIDIAFAHPPGKFTICQESGVGHLKLTLGARGYKLDWDVVENTFANTETGQTIKELVQQAISKHLKRDVEL